MPSRGLQPARNRLATGRSPSLTCGIRKRDLLYQLDRFLAQLDKADLLICDELGYLSFSRTGAEVRQSVFMPNRVRWPESGRLR